MVYLLSSKKTFAEWHSGMSQICVSTPECWHAPLRLLRCFVKLSDEVELACRILHFYYVKNFGRYWIFSPKWANSHIAYANWIWSVTNHLNATLQSWINNWNALINILKMLRGLFKHPLTLILQFFFLVGYSMPTGDSLKKWSPQNLRKLWRNNVNA